ncbi:MAG: alpha/beta hydrolase [Deltaproteobacteria bacterium]|nr:alpha/beta hydrolase [Deltaproteobacteria bacterium]
MKSTRYTLGETPTQVVHAWLPDTDVRAVLHIAHGMAEHGARYARMAEPLVARGWAVYANDLRGHGETAQADEDLGFFAEEDGWNAVLSDLHACVQHERKEHPDVPYVLLGHSLGALLAQQYLYTHGDTIDAAVLSGASGAPSFIAKLGRYVARFERMRLGPQGNSGILNALSFGDFNKKFRPNRTDFDWLSRDEAEVDKYVADPRCGFQCSTQLWVDLLDAIPVLTSPSNQEKIRKDLPIYLFSGSRDPVGEMGKSVRALTASYESVGLSRVTLKLYEDGRHEMMNETNHEEVIGDLVEWLEATISL